MMSPRSRLGSITRHVLPDSAAAPTEPDPGAALKLLDDAQLQTFLGQGFLMLKVEELGPEFHRAVYENAYEEYGPGAEEGGGAHGTTVERVPGLTTLIQSPTVAGALQSLLGPALPQGTEPSGPAPPLLPTFLMAGSLTLLCCCGRTRSAATSADTARATSWSCTTLARPALTAAPPQSFRRPTSSRATGSA